MFDPKTAFNELPKLPPAVDLESKVILKADARAGAALAELKGFSELLPDKQLLIDSIVLQEAKGSSEIENIVTTNDELFKGLAMEENQSPQVKEVLNYRRALWEGVRLLEEMGLLTTNIMVKIQEQIEHNRAGIRKLPGTNLKNESTGEIIYTPPDNESIIRDLLANLEQFLNVDDDGLSPLIKMAAAHFQFESIHPFYNGNGRTGRIINVLYLTMKGLLDSPILYMSKGIIRRKSDYYRLFRELRKNNNWEECILYVLSIVEETSKGTLALVRQISESIENTAELLKKKSPKIYTRELVEIIFKKPYIRINDLVAGKIASRNIASNYLKRIVTLKVLKPVKIGRDVLYENIPLKNVLKNA
ncbi:MAG: Fic family protein [Oligoflexia bacterium]|nr:Fic family protein [Oligoflexia bacterium]